VGCLLLEDNAGVMSTRWLAVPRRATPRTRVNRSAREFIKITKQVYAVRAGIQWRLSEYARAIIRRVYLCYYNPRTDGKNIKPEARVLSR
jgi:hypothetical protein